MPITTINGTKLHYHMKGRGTPIVFITPPLLTKAVFNYQVAQLSDVFKVVTFDIRGQGESAPSEAPITYPLISEDVKQLMDMLELPKVFICGYSTGATIALETMLTYPDRFHGGILLSGMSELSDAYNRGRLSLAVTACRMRAKQLIAYAICRGNADSKTTFNNLYREAMRGDIDNWEQYYHYSMTYSCTDRLRHIHHPMLLMYGRTDFSFHRYAKLLQKELLLTKTVNVNGVAHQLPTKAGAAVSSVIRAWTQDIVPLPSPKRMPETYMIDGMEKQMNGADRTLH